MIYETTIQLRKQDCRQNAKVLKYALYTHLKFCQNSYGIAITNLAMLCYELGYKISRNNIDGPQVKIKETLQELINDQLITIQDFDNPALNELLTIQVIEYEMDGPYVLITANETMKMINISQKGNVKFPYLFNIFAIVKSYINLSANCFNYTGINDELICKIAQCSKNKFMEIKQALLNAGLLYETCFTKSDSCRDIHGRDLSHIYTLQPYSKSDIIKNFK